MRGLTLQDRLDGLIAQAGREHGDGLVLLCSFQKEESVLVDAVVRNAPQTRIVTIDTGVLFPETVETWHDFEQRFGITIAAEDARGDWTGPDNCCSAAKVAGLEHALSTATAWITGIRREQGPTRAATEEVEDDARRGIVKYNPLAEWTEQDLWRVIHDRDLPYHPLHDRGYSSIGCEPCTMPGEGREGRWAGTDKTECGLHVEDGESAITVVQVG